MIAIFKSALF